MLRFHDLHDRDLRPVPLRPSTAPPPPCWPACWSLCCLVLLLLEMRLRGRRRYARVGGGVARSLPRRRGSACCRPGRCWPAGARGRLALGVPLGSLVHWLLVGTSTAFPVGELVSDHRVARSASAWPAPSLTTVARAAGRLARPCATAARLATADRAQHLPRQRPARHRRRAGPGDRVASGSCRPLYQTIVAAARGLRDPVPAAGHGQPARRDGAGAAGARRRGARRWAPARSRRSGGSPCR